MSVEVRKRRLLINDQESKLFSGEVEYWRLEPDYWRPVLEKLKETGMEWVSTYVPWRIHDQGVEEYDLEGRTDERLNLPAYLDLVKELGFKVYFKPGPLIVSEMECGGLPDWLVKTDPHLLIWDWECKIPDGFGGKGQGGVPCYLHPKYLEYCRTWFEAVNDVVSEYFHSNGGPIILYQLDNEVSLVCKDGMFNSDYNPIIVGRGGIYHRWLKEKYGGVSEIPYRGKSKTVEDILPPRDLKEFGSVPIEYYWDWIEFKEHYLSQYLVELRRIHEECGVGEIMFCTNFNPHRPNTVPNNWKKYEEATGGIVGYDFYRSPFLSYSGYLSLARISKMLDGFMKLPWATELQGGCWYEDYTNTPIPTAEHHEFMNIVGIAHGLKAISCYMFHDREKWGASPVSDRAQPRYAHAALKKVMSFVNDVRDFSKLRRESEVAILHYRPYHWHTYLGDPMPCADGQLHIGEPIIDEIPAGKTSSEFEGMFRLLLQAGYDPGVINPWINSHSLGDYKAIFATTQTFMDREAADLLLGFVENGGHLLMGPVVPAKDLSFKSASLFSDMDISSAKRITFADLEINAASGAFTAYDCIYEQSGEALVSLGSVPVITRLKHGAGTITCIGTYLAQPSDGYGPEGNAKLLGWLLEELGIAPIVKTDDREVDAVVQSNDEERYLFLLNTGIRSKKVNVTFREGWNGAAQDVFTREETPVENGLFSVDIDCKMSRVLRLIKRPSTSKCGSR